MTNTYPICPALKALAEMTPAEERTLRHLLAGTAAKWQEDPVVQRLVWDGYRAGRRDLQRSLRGMLGVGS